MNKANKKFVGQLKTGDRVQMHRMVKGHKMLQTFDVIGIEWCDEGSEFEHVNLSLLGVDSDYVGVPLCTTTETIRVVED